MYVLQLNKLHMDSELEIECKKLKQAVLVMIILRDFGIRSYRVKMTRDYKIIIIVDNLNMLQNHQQLALLGEIVDTATYTLKKY